MINNRKNYDELFNSGMFWEFHPELTGNWETDKTKIIDTNKHMIDNDEEYYRQGREYQEMLNRFAANEITEEDNDEMWKQIEKDYLVGSGEKVIIKSTLEKNIDKLKEKELVYRECMNCDSGMVFLSDATQILRELEAELTSQFLKTKI